MHGDIGDRALVARRCSRASAARGRATSPPKATSTARSTAPATSSRPTSSARSSCSKRRAPTGDALAAAERDAFRFLHVSTDEVYGSLGADGRVHRDDAVRAELPYSASKAGGRPPGARLPPHLRPADADDQLLEQLRPVPVPREADPADDPQRARGQAAAGLRRRAATCATGCTSTTTARRSALCSSAGTPGETYNIGGDSETHEPRRRRHASATSLDELQPRPPQQLTRSLITFVARPPGPRPPLRDRRDARSSASSAGRRRRPSRPASRKTVRWYLDNPHWVAARARAATTSELDGSATTRSLRTATRRA